MKKKIYISIPITGHDEKRQREKVDLIKMRLSKEGYDVVNPFDIWAGDNPSYFDHICYDLHALAGCDEAYFCIGWQYSKGCRLERSFCDIYNKPVWFEKEGVWK